MSKRLFFLKQDGWFEADMTDELSAASIENLILQAYKMMERYHYRNYRIIESSPRLYEPPLISASPTSSLLTPRPPLQPGEGAGYLAEKDSALHDL